MNHDKWVWHSIGDRLLGLTSQKGFQRNPTHGLAVDWQYRTVLQLPKVRQSGASGCLDELLGMPKYWPSQRTVTMRIVEMDTGTVIANAVP